MNSVLKELYEEFPDLTLKGTVYEDYHYLGCAHYMKEEECYKEADKAIKKINPTATFCNFVVNKYGKKPKVRYIANWDPYFRGVMYLDL